MKNKAIYQYQFLPKINEYLKENCFFIFGNDSYLKSETLKVLENKFVSKEAKQFDFSVFFGDEDSVSKVLDFLEQFPFLSKFKIVIFRDIHHLKQNDKKILLEYLKSPNPTSKLILTSDKIDQKTATNRALIENCVSIICNSPNDSKNIAGWLNQHLKKHNIMMDGAARQIFINSVELDYQIASSEFEKLIIRTKGKAITASDVTETVGKSRTLHIFDLQKAIGEKNLKLAIHHLENMLENQEAGVFILLMIYRFFFQLWEINILRNSNISDNEIESRYLKKIYSNKKDYLIYASNYNLESLKIVFELLLDTDIKLKSITNIIKESLILEMLIYNIINVKK